MMIPIGPPSRMNAISDTQDGGNLRSEIRDLDSLDAVLQQNIGGLNAAMNHALLVSSSQSFANLPTDAQDFGKIAK